MGPLLFPLPDPRPSQFPPPTYFSGYSEKYHLGSLPSSCFPPQAGQGLPTGSRTSPLGSVSSSWPHPTTLLLLPAGIQPTRLLPAHGSRAGSALCRTLSDRSIFYHRLRPPPAPSHHCQMSEGPDDRRRPEIREERQRSLCLGAKSLSHLLFMKPRANRLPSLSLSFLFCKTYSPLLFPEYLLGAGN